MNRRALTYAILAFASPFMAAATTIIDENFDVGYSRLTQNIAGGNMAIYRSRTSDTATVLPGSLSFFSATASAGSDQFYGYYTDPAANVGSAVQNGHVVVGVGDTFSVSLTFRLETMPAGTTYGLRLGLFDDTGSRSTADLGSGGSSAAFVGNPGYALFVPLTSQAGLNNQLSMRQRTTLTAANIFSAAADFTQIGSTVGGSYTPLASTTNYTLTLTVFRQDAISTVLTTSIIDSSTLAAMTSGSVTNSGTQLTSFDWLAWRSPQQPDAANGGAITFSDINVQLTQVPEPSVFALSGMALLGLAVVRRKLRR